ncbi:hypothetical protein SSX86_018178 [Deinandra increscens subsp. villosa]|uniref:isochorismate synthase n=1 Tax=Deinandra increscens subsp. villosa TaxID=3103831 RepID=A0AAP0CXA0_9ASTR
MPAGPSISRETHYSGDSENIIPELSEEEQNAAQESFSVFFKPTQLYIILDQMASRKPRFLTRCLDYKLKEKLKSRVQLSVSISSRHPDDGEQTPFITPLYILLARPVPTPNGETLRSSCYRFKRACKLTASNGAQTVDSPQARFILPDIDKLSTEFKSGSLAILLVHFAEMTNQPEIDLTKDHMVSPSYEGYCSMAETPVDFVHFSRENSPKINLGERAQIMPTVSLRACYMKLSSSGGVKCVSFDFPQDVEVAQVPITITAEELGAKDIPPLDLHSLNISTDKLPEVLRQRTGEVTFKYKYKYNNNMLHMEEVTEGYSCPFCSQKCASYKVPIEEQIEAIDWLHGQQHFEHHLPRCFFSGRSQRRINGFPSLTTGNDLSDSSPVSTAGLGSAVFFRHVSPFSLRDWRSIKRFLSKKCPLIRAYGAIRFDALADISSEWEAFGSFFFMIPQVEFNEFEGSSMLVTTIAWDESLSWTFGKAVHSLQSTIRQVSSSIVKLRKEVPNTSILSCTNVPSKKLWDFGVNRALQMINRNNSPLIKVVLARSSIIRTSPDIDPLTWLATLQVESENAYQFCLQPPDAPSFIGNTPEQLFHRNRFDIYSEAMAGTRARGDSKALDLQIALDLLYSSKDDKEFSIVRECIRRKLEAVCTTILVEPEKTIRKLTRVQHLYARLRGRLRSEDDEFDILSSLHPTPAVCGFPTEEARKTSIEECMQAQLGGLEEERVSLLLGLGALIYAGTGIVEGSSSSQEWDELELKTSQGIKETKEVDSQGKFTAQRRKMVGKREEERMCFHADMDVREHHNNCIIDVMSSISTMTFVGAQSDPGEVQLVPSAGDSGFVFLHRSGRMPVGPSVSRETHYSGDSEHSFPELSEEEEKAAVESFSVFFKPTELYMLLESLAFKKPRFLTRCLDYKIKEKLKSRVQLSVSISSRHRENGEQPPSISPLYILLARPVLTPNEETLRSRCYRFKRACKLTAYNGAQTVDSPQARFILHDINKLSTEFKSGSLAILLVHFAQKTNQLEIDLTKDHMVSPSYEGYCYMAEAPIDFIHFSRENSPKISLGERAEFTPTVSLRACYMKLNCSVGEKCVSFRFQQDCEVAQILLTITAEELGAKDQSPLDFHSLNISTDKLPEVLRQRTGKVTFKYKYYNDMLDMEEVTEGYGCPFCSQKSASYKGLQCHLQASHYHFNYEFWGDGDYQVVIVTAKITTASSPIVGKVLTGREKAFSFCHRPMRRKHPKRQNANHAEPLVSDPNMPGVSEPIDGELSSPTTASDQLPCGNEGDKA